jgi:hypothetical protein
LLDRTGTIRIMRPSLLLSIVRRAITFFNNQTADR